MAPPERAGPDPTSPGSSNERTSPISVAAQTDRIPRGSKGTPRSVLRTLRTSAGALGRILWANPLSFAGFVLVVFLVVVAVVVTIAPALILPFPAAPSIELSTGNVPPSWSHPFGTDNDGRDIFSNVVAALPLDLGIGFVVAGGALLMGGGLGLVAGYWDRPGSLGGVLSVTIMRLADIFLSFPSLILALAIAASIGRTVPDVMVAVFVSWWPYYTRLARGEVLAVKHQPYIMAARAAGVRERRILLRHVVRNVLEPLMVYFTMDIGTVIVVFSTVVWVIPGVLNYPFAAPEWGAMISTYQNLLATDWWTVIAPAGAIFVTVLAFSLLGDGLRDILDPRSRRAQVAPGATAFSTNLLAEGT